MENFTDYREHMGSNAEKYYKATLFESPRLMLGLNCLEPGQAHSAHSHAEQDKFYFVVEGEGEFSVGEATHRMGLGGVVWAPAGLDLAACSITSDTSGITADTRRFAGKTVSEQFHTKVGAGFRWRGDFGHRECQKRY